MVYELIKEYEEVNYIFNQKLNIVLNSSHDYDIRLHRAIDEITDYKICLEKKLEDYKI